MENIDSGRHDWSFQVLCIGATLILFAALQGCATLSEADCLTADWVVMGEVDGQEGKPLSVLNDYRRQCADYGVAPDSQAYMEARERGLTRFCTQTNGYLQGRSGARDQRVCPATLDPEFRSGHQLGRAVYTSLTALRSSSDSISSARSEIAELRSDIEDREESLRSDELSDEQRENLRDEINSMNRRIDQREDEIAISTGTLALAIAEYRAAVSAARSEGYDEPMETELLRELQRLAR